MKKTLFSLLMLSGLLMADQSENVAVCDGLKDNMPKIYEVYVDYLSLMSGKEEKCEDHTQEELQNFGTTAEAGILVGLNHILSAENYATVLSALKKDQAKTASQMKEVLGKVMPQGEGVKQ